MRIAKALAAVLLLAVGPSHAARAVPPGPQSAPQASEANPADLVAGSNLFTISCSSSYCHGLGGAGGRGPSLQNRAFTADYIRTTVLQGRPGTPMPSFKSNFTPAELSLLVNYVLSLSPESTAGGGAEAKPLSEVAMSKQATQGSDVFFDQSRPAPCSTCHSFHGNGGPVGPDLAAISAKTPHDIYQSIVHPAAAAAYPAIAVSTTDGMSFTGIKRDDKHDVLRVYDLSSTPPVLRSLAKSEVTKVEPLDKSPAYRHDLSAYSKDDVLALVAFLKAGAANAPADVKPEDIGPLQ